jgi:hypothetical protein
MIDQGHGTPLAFGWFIITALVLLMKGASISRRRATRGGRCQPKAKETARVSSGSGSAVAASVGDDKQGARQSGGRADDVGLFVVDIDGICAGHGRAFLNDGGLEFLNQR